MRNDSKEHNLLSGEPHISVTVGQCTCYQTAFFFSPLNPGLQRTSITPVTAIASRLCLGMCSLLKDTVELQLASHSFTFPEVPDVFSVSPSFC